MKVRLSKGGPTLNFEVRERQKPQTDEIEKSKTLRSIGPSLRSAVRHI